MKMKLRDWMPGIENYCWLVDRRLTFILKLQILFFLFLIGFRFGIGWFTVYYFLHFSTLKLISLFYLFIFLIITFISKTPFLTSLTKGSIFGNRLSFRHYFSISFDNLLFSELSFTFLLFFSADPLAEHFYYLLEVSQRWFYDLLSLVPIFFSYFLCYKPICSVNWHLFTLLFLGDRFIDFLCYYMEIFIILLVIHISLQELTSISISFSSTLKES